MLLQELPVGRQPRLALVNAVPEPEINVDLSREVLKLSICAECKAITRREDIAWHVAGHDGLDERL